MAHFGPLSGPLPYIRVFQATILSIKSKKTKYEGCTTSNIFLDVWLFQPLHLGDQSYKFSFICGDSAAIICDHDVLLVVRRSTPRPVEAAAQEPTGVNHRELVMQVARASVNINVYALLHELPVFKPIPASSALVNQIR